MLSIGYWYETDEADDVGGRPRIREAREGDAEGGIFGEDGNADAVGGILRADRAVLPEGWKRTTADWTGTHAAHVQRGELVQSGRRSL